jgi:hypothetical protein
MCTTVFADEVIKVNTGDYELFKTKVSNSTKAGEVTKTEEYETLYRLNNKTGDTWVFSLSNGGWVKVSDWRGTDKEMATVPPTTQLKQ